jgi:transcription elongation factor Elf1
MKKKIQKITATALAVMTLAGSTAALGLSIDNSFMPTVVAEAATTSSTTQTTLKNTSTISSTKVKVGSKVTIAPRASGGAGGYTYTVQYRKSTVNAWINATVVNGTNTRTVTLNEPTIYDIRVIIKDKNGATSTKTFMTQAYKEGSISNNMGSGCIAGTKKSTTLNNIKFDYIVTNNKAYIYRMTVLNNEKTIRIPNKLNGVIVTYIDKGAIIDKSLNMGAIEIYSVDNVYTNINIHKEAFKYRESTIQENNYITKLNIKRVNVKLVDINYNSKGERQTVSNTYSFANSIPNIIKLDIETKNIDNNMFKNCKSITDVHIKTTRVGVSTFENCTGLKKLYIYGSVEPVKQIDTKAFYNCNKLNEVAIVDHDKKLDINTSAFENCKNLQHFHIANAKASINNLNDFNDAQFAVNSTGTVKVKNTYLSIQDPYNGPSSYSLIYTNENEKDSMNHNLCGAQLSFFNDDLIINAGTTNTSLNNQLPKYTKNATVRDMSPALVNIQQNDTFTYKVINKTLKDSSTSSNGTIKNIYKYTLDLTNNNKSHANIRVTFEATVYDNITATIKISDKAFKNSFLYKIDQYQDLYINKNAKTKTTSISYIGNEAFYNCKLDTFKFDYDTLKYIGTSAFENSKIKHVIISGTNSNNISKISLGKNAFKNINIIYNDNVKEVIDNLGMYYLMIQSVDEKNIFNYIDPKSLINNTYDFKLYDITLGQKEDITISTLPFKFLEKYYDKITYKVEYSRTGDKWHTITPKNDIYTIKPTSTGTIKVRMTIIAEVNSKTYTGNYRTSQFKIIK